MRVQTWTSVTTDSGNWDFVGLSLYPARVRSLSLIKTRMWTGVARLRRTLNFYKWGHISSILHIRGTFIKQYISEF